MAALTYLELTNAVLKKLNEVRLTSTTFADARGIHAEIKEAVNTAVLEVNQTEFQWPFNHVTHTETLVPLQQTFALPADCKTVDWESFFMLRDDALEVSARKLPMMDYTHFMQTRAARDFNDTKGSDPVAVFPTQADEFGVTPPPDQPYSIQFQYWGYNDEMVNHDDVTAIPRQFKSVIVDGALIHGYGFKGNEQASVNAAARFRRGLSRMRTMLINKYQYVTDTRGGAYVGVKF